MDTSLLKTIFSDADLIDIDFSKWDSCVVLWVVADHLPRDCDGTIPVVSVMFQDTKLFNWKFNSQSGEECLQWNIYKCSFVESIDGITVVLSGSKTMPSLTIKCRSIKVDFGDKADLSLINPNWKRPGSGLARPGILQLAALQRAKNARGA